MSSAEFAHPAPPKSRIRIVPFFLPNAGCSQRCAFCDQYRQTGNAEYQEFDLGEFCNKVESFCSQNTLSSSFEKEIAIYGGSFTGLPKKMIDTILARLLNAANAGCITASRCSTRPDLVTPAICKQLKSHKMRAVELGVQSFSDQVLVACNRGHTAEQAMHGCEVVSASGLNLSVHLMLGLPYQTEDIFLADVRQVAKLRPRSVRIHPTIVLEGTMLHSMYVHGVYTPTGLDEAIELLAKALGILWAAGVVVSRIGVAPEKDFTSAAVAGPWHPALGQRAASLALFQHVREQVRAFGRPVRSMNIPQQYISDFWGWKGENRSRYAGLGITPAVVQPWPEKMFLLEG